MRDCGPAGSSPSASSVSAAVSVRSLASARHTGGGGGGGGGGGRMILPGAATDSFSWAKTCGEREEGEEGGRRRKEQSLWKKGGGWTTHRACGYQE